MNRGDNSQRGLHMAKIFCHFCDFPKVNLKLYPVHDVLIHQYNCLQGIQLNKVSFT